MAPIRIFSIGCLFFFICIAYANADITLNAGTQYNYAEHLYNTKNYTAAAYEYSRFLYFFPEDKLHDTAEFKTAMCWLKAGDLRKAAKLFCQIPFSSKEYINSQFAAAKCYEGIQDPGSAIVTLRNILSSKNNTELNDKALNAIGWMTLKTGNFDASVKTFSNISKKGEKTI